MIFTHKHSFNRIVCILMVAIFSSACGVPLEQSGAAPAQVEIQATSPLPTEQTPAPTALSTEELEQPDASSTPMTTPTVINLAKGLPNSKIIVIVVRRANGDVQEFVLPNAPFNATDDFDAELRREINWGPQDDILSVRCGGCNPPLRMAPPPADFVITPFPSPTVIDLMQGMTQVETLVVLIQRANGDYEQYRLPMSPVFTSPAAMDELTKQLHLTPEDVFIDAFRTGQTVPQSTPTLITTPVLTSVDVLSPLQTPPLKSEPTRTPSP